NLSAWDGRNPNFALNQNVVIRDTLPSHAEWQSGDADFITADGITLTQAADCPADVADFMADEFAGQWCVDGRTLLVNVGKDNAANVIVHVKAQLNTVEGL